MRLPRGVNGSEAATLYHRGAVRSLCTDAPATLRRDEPRRGLASGGAPWEDALVSTPTPGSAPLRPKLTRSRDRMIAGVCGGIAEWFGWKPDRVRIAYVIASILSAAFPGIIVYLLLWLVMPEPDE